MKVRKLGADSLDALYTALKRCSRLCGRLPKVEHHTEGQHACDQRCGPLRDHRTTRPHTCDSRCRPHVCKPMRPATILRIHCTLTAQAAYAAYADVAAGIDRARLPLLVDLASLGAPAAVVAARTRATARPARRRSAAGGG